MKAKNRFFTVCCAAAAAGLLFTACPVTALASEGSADVSSAEKCYEEASDLLEQFNGCANDAEKRALLEISNNNLSNDSFRSKLYKENGGEWDELEPEILAATANLLDKVLYVQPFMLTESGVMTRPVIYAGSVAEVDGPNRWATNLVYDAENGTWYEYDNVNQWGTLSSYSMTNLWNKLSWDEFMAQVTAEGSYWKPLTISSEGDDEDGKPAGDDEDGKPAGDDEDGKPAADDEDGNPPAVTEENSLPLAQPETAIEDDETPLAQPAVTAAPAVTVSPAAVPATGDESVVPMAAGLVLVSLAGCLLLKRKVK